MTKDNQSASSTQGAALPPGSQPTSPRSTRPLPENIPTAPYGRGQSGGAAPAYVPPIQQRHQSGKKWLWLFLALLFLITLLAIVLAHFSPEHNGIDSTRASGRQSFSVGDHALLIIKGHSSNIFLHAGNAGTIEVRIHQTNSTKTPTDTNLQATQDHDQQGNDRLTLAPDPYFHNLDYDITAPASTRLQVDVDSGSFAVSGIGETDLTTENGSIDISDISGPVRAQTTNGDITVRSVQGAVTLDDENGSIHISDITGQLRAVTRSGDIIARTSKLAGQSLLETQNGSVRVSAALNPDGSYHLESTSGDIDLNLPADAAFQLTASTGSGSVRNTFGSSSIGIGARAKIVIGTTNGSISIDNTDLP